MEIVRLTGPAFAPDLARVYNSANLLFPEEMRGYAADEVFLTQLSQGENYAFRDDNGKIVGFFSCSRNGGLWELTSLYVDLEHQRMGAGEQLLAHFERLVPRGETIFVKALKNAPWALSFYRKHGYQPIDDQMRDRAKRLGIEEKPWSQVLWKEGKSDSMAFFSRLEGFPFKILNEQDVPLVYELLLENPLYFQHCPPLPTHESIRRDMKALPPGKGYEDKHYGGLFAGDRLIAVLDLITGYPDEKTLFIGFFMVRGEEQLRGLGTRIISELCREAHAKGFAHIRLGYAKGNPQSRAFWEKNHFVPTGTETQTSGYTIVVMQRDLSE